MTTDIAGKLKVLHDATTPGAWYAVNVGPHCVLLDGPNYGDRSLDGGGEDADAPGVSLTQGERNMRFAAYAHNVLPEMLEQLDAVTRERDELREHAELLDENWSAVHEAAMSAFRDAFGMPDASIPEMLERLARLRSEPAA